METIKNDYRTSSLRQTSKDLISMAIRTFPVHARLIWPSVIPSEPRTPWNNKGTVGLWKKNDELVTESKVWPSVKLETQTNPSVLTAWPTSGWSSRFLQTWRPTRKSSTPKLPQRPSIQQEVGRTLLSDGAPRISSRNVMVSPDIRLTNSPGISWSLGRLACRFGLFTLLLSSSPRLLSLSLSLSLFQRDTPNLQGYLFSLVTFRLEQLSLSRFIYSG